MTGHSPVEQALPYDQLLSKYEDVLSRLTMEQYNRGVERGKHGRMVEDLSFWLETAQSALEGNPNEFRLKAARERIDRCLKALAK